MTPISTPGVTVAVDYQVLFNIALGLAGMFMGWFINDLTAAVKELRMTVIRTREEYLPKVEYHADLAKIDARFDKTDAKLEHIGERIDLKLDRLAEKIDKANSG